MRAWDLVGVAGTDGPVEQVSSALLPKALSELLGFWGSGVLGV